MAVDKNNVRVPITMTKENADLLNHMAKKMGASKTAIFNIAFFDFVEKYYPYEKPNTKK